MIVLALAAPRLIRRILSTSSQPKFCALSLFLGECTGPDKAARSRNKNDLIGALKDDKMPTAVNASNRHAGRSRAVRIHAVGT